MFHFPVKHWLRALFSRADVVPFMHADCGERPATHISHSRAYHAKITANPHMNSDHRNGGVVGTTDGVPFFDDQHRGAWPFILRHSSLPDPLSMSTVNCHLHLLSANEYWELDADANVLRRRIRAPRSLMPHMHVICDDLLGAYTKGLTDVLCACVDVLCSCVNVLCRRVNVMCHYVDVSV
jgi:hypothetical protein